MKRLECNEEACTRRAATDGDLNGGLLGLSGTSLLNEAGSRWADCLPPVEIEWLDRLPVDPVGRV
jgi:hypothetical protein